MTHHIEHKNLLRNYKALLQELEVRFIDSGAKATICWGEVNLSINSKQEQLASLMSIMLFKEKLRDLWGESLIIEP